MGRRPMALGTSERASGCHDKIFGIYIFFFSKMAILHNKNTFENSSLL